MQLLILQVTCIVGSLTFFLVEWSSVTEREKSISSASAQEDDENSGEDKEMSTGSSSVGNLEEETDDSGEQSPLKNDVLYEVK